MKRMLIGSVVLVVISIVGFVYVRTAFAHCDTMNGPVVTAAQRALESGNVNYVLPWISEKDEAEIRSAFEHARQVRALGPEAKRLADMYFFETLVRVHRASEGEPYTGLKPAGAEANPAVAAADKALETGSADALTALLTKAVKEGVISRFAEAKAAQSKDINNVEGRRRGVHAYVELVHYAEAIYNSATGSQPEGEVAHGGTETH